LCRWHWRYSAYFANRNTAYITYVKVKTILLLFFYFLPPRTPSNIELLTLGM
jgi:hypothetical protein